MPPKVEIRLNTPKTAMEPLPPKNRDEVLAVENKPSPKVASALDMPTEIGSPISDSPTPVLENPNAYEVDVEPDKISNCASSQHHIKVDPHAQEIKIEDEQHENCAIKTEDMDAESIIHVDDDENPSKDQAPALKKKRKQGPRNVMEFHRQQRQAKLAKTAASPEPGANSTNTNEDKRTILNDLLCHDATSAYKSGPDLNPEFHIAILNKRDFFKSIRDKCPTADFAKTNAELKMLDDDARSFGSRRISFKNNMWFLKGMKKGIYHHQLKGAAWMGNRECSEDGPFGGILADDMGLGKTIQAITAMSGNLPTKENVRLQNKSTLIIAPTSLVHQWKAEMEAFSSFQRIMIYNPKDSNNDTLRTTDNDVVIVSYDSVQRSWLHPTESELKRLRGQAKKEGMSFEDGLAEWLAEIDRAVDPIYKIDWFRIVLDEAHYIKNMESRTARSVNSLIGKYRWALSGTPIMNGYEGGVFPSLPSYAATNHSRKITATLMMINIEALGMAISRVTMRRSMKDEILGRKLVPLGEPTNIVQKVKASPPERLILKYIQDKFDMLRKGKYDPGDPRRELKNMLNQITRSRQLNSNPDIIEEHVMVMFELDELKQMKTDLDAMQCTLKDSDDLRRALARRINGWISSKRESTRSGKRMLAQKPVFTCPVLNCNQTFTTSEGEVTPCDAAIIANKTPGKKTSLKGRKAVDAVGFRPITTSSLKWLQKFDDSKYQILPTAKLSGVTKLILEWRVYHPSDKVVVFIQFTHFGIMLGGLLQKNKVKFVYTTGGMTSKQRSAALEKFKNDSNVNVMIIGLKIGGQGLNLQFANRGILVDPYWNKSIEHQAAGRINRIGQVKPTFLVSFVMEGTIDERILELQNEKQEMIGKAYKGLNETQQLRLLEEYQNRDLGQDSDDEDDFSHAIHAEGDPMADLGIPEEEYQSWLTSDEAA
ncbi:hypothetical protein MBM_09547 [Drepanopeziza brunnea f. sp. 'multigermtubi' MB_m1]|uniref:SNF2 family domain-containing protein n=1 Tax=Marssonina brunnea f. sp. multigermtubi (strain MB_m1) TaxID=1072389 RepID=K1WHE0_MARBU|nr:uncharacterized protein MBM_09547 [Drepanopeziza brunnea f. sp. 'multigermtubi' MB_m1]EKD12226.1 hypothetical protein MBM_09547 [Drepanopeziza brunnea f. sp. 'multigermtubi' MB_m1]